MMMMMEKEKETSFKSYRIEIPIKTIAHLEYLRCQYSRDLFKKKSYIKFLTLLILIMIGTINFASLHFHIFHTILE